MEGTPIERLAVLEHKAEELAYDVKDMKKDLKVLVKFTNQFKAVVALVLAGPAIFGLASWAADDEKGVNYNVGKTDDIFAESYSEEHRE